MKSKRMPKSSYTLKKGQTHINAVQEFLCAHQAIEYLKKIYFQSLQGLKDSFNILHSTSECSPQTTSYFYPYVGINISPEHLTNDLMLSHGIFDTAGFYGTTITRPDIFQEYLLEQFSILLERYQQPLLIGLSEWPIPLSFAVEYSKTSLNSEQMNFLKLNFDFPQLTRITDDIVNCTHHLTPEQPKPLALFSGERTDFSLHRLHHYTGTSPEHFQNFIILTNYQRYTDEFIKYAYGELTINDQYESFVEPGDHVILNSSLQTDHHPTNQKVLNMPQMPAYHLKKPDKSGITFINIGVGPTNAKNITDHLAVLRPHCWLMLGHCAGLKRNQMLGDYVLAHGYVREDSVLDDDLPLWIPVPPLAEVQIALQDAFSEITGLKGVDIKTRLRTGTVYTTDNRNWELRAHEIFKRFNQSRAMALDMESATIAANGLRFRVPYGTLLCVSDKPVHGEIKMRGMANNFYDDRVFQHFKIGLKAIELISQRGTNSLHSQKLRGFDEPAFR